MVLNVMLGVLPLILTIVGKPSQSMLLRITGDEASLRMPFPTAAVSLTNVQCNISGDADESASAPPAPALFPTNRQLMMVSVTADVLNKPPPAPDPVLSRN